MAEHKPTRKQPKPSLSLDVFKSMGKGGFSGSAKAGRNWGLSERKPMGSGKRPTGRGR